MSDLFDVGQPAIAKHLKNIFESQELQESAVYSKMEYTATDGKKYKTGFYNLDAIISVGYRVNSQKATRFRQWATKILKEFMIKGFVLDDERLKQGERIFNQDYFQELLERVRSIRASERRVWQKVTDIFAEISSDYDKDSDVTKRFYALVQNKFHYAITGETAAEIIKSRANHKNANMGLTTWKNSPDGRILKSDTGIAKNYLDEKQIKSLERNVSSYLDYIEDLIERRTNFTMEDCAQSIDNFLAFREYQVLDGYGKVSMKEAKSAASQEYDAFNKTQKIISDFDKQTKNLK
ncbi:virulence RhuM family protein [Lactococcus sp. dk322]|nr:cell filamentation protein Fic [Lactococcus sp. dk101]TXK38129.1 virulence RhuM family protein [Lactococcus sp. dk310]TXK49807.1 virulence RhuM family protein [Lactococcus sp. dk322]